MNGKIAMPPSPVVLLAIASMLFGGCVERKLTIRSEPVGADVYVDEVLIGKTPCEHPFLFYGDREIMIEKEGYRTIKEEVDVHPPFYQFIPLDFITEAVIPFTITDERVFEYTLTKGASEEDIREIMKRAVEMRGKALKKDDGANE